NSAKLLHVGIVNGCLERSLVDGLFWLRFVETRDEADPDTSVKPFPTNLEYLRELWSILSEQHRVVIAKSRQMLVSWVVCACCVWWARFTPRQAVSCQARRWRAAWGRVCQPDGGRPGRCQCMSEVLAAW